MISHELVDSPELQAEHDVSGLLAGVGNHEAEALLLGLMQEGEYYSGLGLSRLLQSAQGLEPTTHWSHSVAGSYAGNSFEPIGCVAKADYGDVLRFGITARGNAVGKAVAGYLLDISDRYPQVSLRRLLSMTESTNPNERTPYGRFRFYEQIVEAGGTIEATKLLGDDHVPLETRQTRLREMETDGMIEFRNVPVVGSRYTVLSIELMGDLPGLSNNHPRSILDRFVRSRGSGSSFTTQELYQYIAKESGAIEVARTNKQVISWLRSLAANGVVKSEYSKRYTERQISLASDKAEAIRELVSVVRDLHEPNEDFIAEGKRRLSAILDDTGRVKNLLEKAEANSPQKGALPKARRVELVLRAMRELSDPVDPQAIKDRIGHPKVTIVSVQKILRELEKTETVKRGERVGRLLTKWTVVKPLSDKL